MGSLHLYEIYQVIIKYLNKKTLCRLRTISHESHDYIKKPKPFKEEKLRKQRDKNILDKNICIFNQYMFVPKKYFYINKVIYNHSQIKVIVYKIGSEILYGTLYYNIPPPFDEKKEYYSRYSKSFKNKRTL